MTADICFLGTGYLDYGNCKTETDWKIAQMKKTMINASNHMVTMTISKKLNTIARYKTWTVNTLNDVVKELHPNSELLIPYS